MIALIDLISRERKEAAHTKKKRMLFDGLLNNL
jgi:hypothetical protein